MDFATTLETAPALAKDQEIVSRFLDGYASARGDGLVPVLQDYVVGALLPFLPDVTVLELVAPGEITYRLCGTNIVQRIGQEVTGMNLLDFFLPELREATFIDSTSIVTIPCGNYSRYQNIYASGLLAEVESISLPVRSEENANVNFLMTFHTLEEVALENLTGEETRVGISWSESTFINLGNGIPGRNALGELIG